MINILFQSLYFSIMRRLKPVIVWAGKIYPKFSSKEHIFKRYYEITSSLMVGDVILTVSDAHFSNLLNPGFWKHAVIYTGVESHENLSPYPVPMICEAIGEGVVKRPLLEMLASKDRLVILRPTTKLLKNYEQKRIYIDFVLAQVGKPYDHDFNGFEQQTASDSFYCSELFYSGIITANPDADFNLRKTFGIFTVTPSDIRGMARSGKVEVVLEIL